MPEISGRSSTSTYSLEESRSVTLPLNPALCEPSTQKLDIPEIPSGTTASEANVRPSAMVPGPPVTRPTREGVSRAMKPSASATSRSAVIPGWGGCSRRSFR